MKQMSLAVMVLVIALMATVGCGDGESVGDDQKDAGGDDVEEQQDTEETGLSLESIYPVAGGTDGGDEASLYGTGFVEESAVTFGQEEAETTFVSATELDVVTPGGEPGFVDVTVNNPDGEVSTLEEGFEYVVDETDPLEIGWCNLQYPSETTTSVDTETEPIFGRVYVEDCTGAETECESIIGQVGFGPDDVDPTESSGEYEWSDADYNPGYPGEGESNNDEHMGTLTPSTEGSFGYAFRFSGDDGESWTYCDLSGTDDGFSIDEMGTLTVDP